MSKTRAKLTRLGDMPTRYNSRIYDNDGNAAADADAVAVLRTAGALILGKTATTEFAAKVEGGACCNPRSLQHTPGGSSSGSAAAVGDNQVPLSLGTQTGGSVIRPGSFNGLYAFKASGLLKPVPSGAMPCCFVHLPFTSLLATTAV